jgi:hypothetical protein
MLLSLRMVIPLIKKLTLVVLLGAILYFFIEAIVDLETIYNDFGKTFFYENGFRDTGSKNLVTGIYLDYRLFDSLFEAGILLIAVSGVMWISQHKIKEKNANFMLDKYKTPDLFITFSRLLYPCDASIWILCHHQRTSITRWRIPRWRDCCNRNFDFILYRCFKSQLM